MAHLIDKDALVAEIKSRISDIEVSQKAGLIKKRDADKKILLFKSILYFLDTLQAKEVDLEKEIENLIEKEKAFVTDNREVKYYNGDSFNHIYELEFIAKHFFELGLKVAQKGE